MAPEASRIRVIGYAGIVLTGIYLGVHSCQAAREEKEAARFVRSVIEASQDKNAPTAEPSAAEAYAERGPQTAETGTTATEKPAPRSGPFGLAAGMTLAELRAISKVERDPGEANWYRIVPQKPDPAFVEYLTMVGPTVGLCKIAAFGPTIRTNLSGKELKSAFDMVDRALQATYGPRDKRELGKRGRTWDASTRWMAGLLKKELMYASLWGGNEVPLQQKAGGIDWLALDAHAESLEEGFLSLVVGFDNLKRCEEEDDKEKNENEARSGGLDTTERPTPGR